MSGNRDHQNLVGNLDQGFKLVEMKVITIRHLEGAQIVSKKIFKVKKKKKNVLENHFHKWQNSNGGDDVDTHSGKGERRISKAAHQAPELTAGASRHAAEMWRSPPDACASARATARRLLARRMAARAQTTAGERRPMAEDKTGWTS